MAVNSASPKAPALVLISILPERQVEPPRDVEIRRRRPRNDPRHAVIPEPGGAAEDERVARFEQQRLNRIAPLKAAKQEARGIAERNRDDAETCVELCSP